MLLCSVLGIQTGSLLLHGYCTMPAATQHSYEPTCPPPLPRLPPRPALPAPPAAASLGDTATPLGKAVRILNNQLQALTQVDARIEDLSQRVADLHPN